jgi:hypothetical protein
VKFLPDTEGKRASQGLTDDQGNFTLTHSRSESGILPGRHTVFLQYHVSAEEEMHKIPPKASSEIRAVIAKYSTPKTSTLHYDITSSGQFIDIKLE